MKLLFYLISDLTTEFKHNIEFIVKLYPKLVYHKSLKFSYPLRISAKCSKPVSMG